jgi:hypothetical protein
MMFYTVIGLCIATFYIISFGDLVIQRDSKQIVIQEMDEENLARISKKEFVENMSKKVGVLIIVSIFLWWIGFSVIFAITEPDWTFFEAFYFTFVSMSGIGYSIN